MENRLKGKRIVFIIAQHNFRDEELIEPKRYLEAEGAEVKIASIELKEARGMLGARVMPNLRVREIDPEAYDALVLVGGTGSPSLADYPEVMNVIKRFHELGKIIGAICLAPYLLARANVIAGNKVTAWPEDFAISALRKAGAIYTKEEVTVDGKLVTAIGPQAVKSFAKELSRLLA